VNEYTVIGAGPAGILAVVRILQALLNTTPNIITAKKFAKKVCWIDPQFKVGAFGQEWRHVPGNTTASKYRAVYDDIFAILNVYGITSPDLNSFALYSEDREYPSLLETAAEPLRWMTAALQPLVTPMTGQAIEILGAINDFQIHLVSGEILHAKKCILALGGRAKNLLLPDADKGKIIPLEIALDRALLKKFVTRQADTIHSAVLVQGSSHSAALAVWNLLACGISVKQIMNKPYRYYAMQQNSHGMACSVNENTGLKGAVAHFTRALEAKTVYSHQWSYDILSSDQPLDYSPYDYIISAIGLEPADSLSIQGVSSARLRYDHHTTRTEIPGVFAIGVGHPLAAEDGSKNVGISKFWPDIGRVISHW